MNDLPPTLPTDEQSQVPSGTWQSVGAQPVTQQMEEHHSSHVLRNILLGMLFCLLIASVAMGGYYMGQKSKTTPYASSYPTPSTAPITTNVPSPTPAPLIYTDTTLGISFSYPATWEVNQTEALGGYWLQLVQKGKSEPNHYGGPIQIETGINGQPGTTVTAQDFVHKGSSSTVTPTTIAGLSGFLVTNANCEPYICDTQAIVAYNNKGYIFNSFATPNQPLPEDQKQAFDLLIKTFKFIK